MAALTDHDLTLEIGFHDRRWQDAGETVFVIYYNIWLLSGGEPLLNDAVLQPNRWSRPIGTRPGWIEAADWGGCNILPMLKRVLRREGKGDWPALDENVRLTIGTDILSPYLDTPLPEQDVRLAPLREDVREPIPGYVDWLVRRAGDNAYLEVLLLIDGDNFHSEGLSENGLIFRLTPTLSALQRFHDDLQADHDAFFAERGGKP